MPGIRCFVAVELDDDARREAAGLMDLLRHTGADVKWVPPVNLHLTLKFLGDVSPGDIRNVALAVRKAVAGSGSFLFELAGVGAFPSISRPRVIWMGVTSGRDELSGLASQVEKALVPLGFPPDARGFSPHLTLGRCRSDRGMLELKAALDGERDYSGGAVRVRRVVLFSSDLGPGGPVYAPLETFPLQAGREHQGY